ncbi:MAG: hypothetical protein QW112_03235 [Candidatus Micrarchaeia archaeon]
MAYPYHTRDAGRIERKALGVIVGSIVVGGVAGEFVGRRIGLQPGIGAALGTGIILFATSPLVEKILRKADEGESAGKSDQNQGEQ